MISGKMSITNFEYAAAVGIHYTMASRLRNGDRLPGLKTVISTIKAYGLDCEQVTAWLEAIDEGSEESGAWLRANIFGDADTTALPAAG